MNQIIIPTIDTIRYNALMKILVTHEKSVLFVGPVSGKIKGFNYIQSHFMPKM